MTEIILVIDNTPDILVVIQQVMELAGYKVLTALDGESGWQLFYECLPALVILEIILPKIDGWEICGRIRQVSSVPIIVHSALGTEKDIIRALKIGADDYLVKPAMPAIIRTRAAAALNYQAKLDELLPQRRLPHG
jgi:DNA-binding response OmpR family regulator